MVRWPWNLWSEAATDGALASDTATEPAQGSSRKPFPSGIKLLHDSESSVVDIVFVHGLTGDREETWRAKSTAGPWPQTLLPSELPDARMLTFGYDAYVTDWRGMVSKNRVGDHAMNLLTAVATCRERDGSNDRPIIFVCHSLGGLVCEDALSTARNLPEDHLKKVFDCTRAIIFLGTPHHGAGLANWAERLARHINVLKQTNPEILAVLKGDSEVLGRVQNSFHSMIRSRNQGHQPIEITCFYEELPLPGVGIVVPSNSAILPGYTPIGIRSNHMGMTKFDSVEDPGFIAVVGELRRWTRDIARLGGRRPFLRGESSQKQLEEKCVEGPATRHDLDMAKHGFNYRTTTANDGSLFQENFNSYYPNSTKHKSQQIHALGTVGARAKKPWSATATNGKHGSGTSIWQILRENNQCFRCGTEGHWWRDCYVSDDKVQWFRRKYRLCYKCGGEHYQDTCPNT